MCDDIGYRQNISDQLSTEWITFMATFGRFEYALKNAGYILVGNEVKNSGLTMATGETAKKVSANWDAFASDLTNTFFDVCKKDDFLKILFDEPPKIRVVVGATLFWSKARQVSNVTELFQVVRDVRNSLFHGEKHLGRERDHDLILAAQRVLDCAMDKAKAEQIQSKLASVYENFEFH